MKAFNWTRLALVCCLALCCRCLRAEDGLGRRAGDVITVSLGGVDVNFRWCPPGEFFMGSQENEPFRVEDEVRHKVEIPRGFWLGETPVTVEAFRAFVEETGYKTDAERNGDGASWREPGLTVPPFTQTPNHPVVLVTWYDARKFVAWANKKYAPRGMTFKLPSEPHWEYACRAGTQTAYWWGNDLEGGEGCANVADVSAEREFPEWSSFFAFNDGYVATSPVGSFRANPWGLRDMIGNVWEWCADWYAEYPVGPVEIPSGSSDDWDRVTRGGGWASLPWGNRSARRYPKAPGARDDDLGFRLELQEDRSATSGVAPSESYPTGAFDSDNEYRLLVFTWRRLGGYKPSDSVRPFIEELASESWYPIEYVYVDDANADVDALQERWRSQSTPTVRLIARSKDGEEKEIRRWVGSEEVKNVRVDLIRFELEELKRRLEKSLQEPSLETKWEESNAGSEETTIISGSREEDRWAL